MSKMSQNQGCGFGSNTNPEYLLSGLDEETPTNSVTNVENSATLLTPVETENLEKKYEARAISKITVIKLEVEHIKEQILSLEKETLQNDFKKYEEVLIRKTIELDNVETKGIEDVREIRKEAIIFVQDCLKLLDQLIKEQKDSKNTNNQNQFGNNYE